MDQQPYWNVDNPAKPWGLFDPNADLVYPMSWAAALADASATYVSHQIICEAGLECVSSTETAGVISARIRKAVGATLRKGKKYQVTWRVTFTSDGVINQVDDRSIYLKIQER
jgi:hypothetical protein